MGEREERTHQHELTSSSPRIKGEKKGRKKGDGQLALYGSVAWRESVVALESLARQGRVHAPSRQLRSMSGTTVARLVTPTHVTRQHGTTLARPKGLLL